jgi:hypothetical protein
MTPEQKRQATEMLLSWGRVFLAASLATFASLDSFNLSNAINAGLAALIPVAIRYFDKNDKVYGRQ